MWSFSRNTVHKYTHAQRACTGGVNYTVVPDSCKYPVLLAERENGSSERIVTVTVADSQQNACFPVTLDAGLENQLGENCQFYFCGQWNELACYAMY